MATMPKLAYSCAAEGSGGAYLHSGIAVDLKNCTFVRNKAGGEGIAVLSLGMVEEMSSVDFDSNTKFCGSGTYGLEMNASEAKVRCYHGTQYIPILRFHFYSAAGRSCGRV